MFEIFLNSYNTGINSNIFKKIMSKIFITGGAGYVGSKLVPKLLSKGHEVTVLDLMIYGSNVLENNEKLKKTYR